MVDTDWAGRAARLPDEDLVEIVSSGDTGGFEPHVIEAAAVVNFPLKPSQTSKRRLRNCNRLVTVGQPSR